MILPFFENQPSAIIDLVHMLMKGTLLLLLYEEFLANLYQHLPARKEKENILLFLKMYIFITFLIMMAFIFTAFVFDLLIF